ncbi:MAG: quinone-dependent dihydroorotate dehydrogenase [Myxococcales bacterium]|nr:quinone-dependent dihydroorotate dehydrogenase [Myxococcales bacterium]
MYGLLKKVFFSMDAESAHLWALRGARLATPWRSLWQGFFQVEDPRLVQDIAGMHFRGPVGLAAGADKNAEAVAFWFGVGFGFVEVGAITAQSSAGNPKPRAFRLPQDQALINRMGLNNHGAVATSERLRALSKRALGPVGANLAKTHDPSILGDDAIDDFAQSFRLVAPHVDYIALNVSCPNTTEGKTFEDPTSFAQLLEAIFQEKTTLGLNVPIFVKLSPPVDPEDVDPSGELGEIVDLGCRLGVDGWIASNTASDRSGLQSPEKQIQLIGRGGLSGRPLAQRSTALVRYLYRRCDGKLPIIGVGGIFDAESAYEKVLAGASLLQMYTGLVYEGPGVVKRIHRGLLRLLERDGYGHLREAVGKKAD